MQTNNKTGNQQVPEHPMYTQEPRASFSPKCINPPSNFSKEDFFIFRLPLLNQAIKDIESQLSEDEDGELHSVWIMTQITHWGAECELLAFLSAHSLLLCYYDFVGLSSSRLFRIPLNYIDTVTWGPLTYPRTALSK
ncbi:tumor protein p63-regulated gene 1-like protein [Bombina bombina]|uniref:tumor protein p63-regulated gene 1-like protein n=1 Tax=Bombina bombina TaxID=8345 RepID=UPI00235A7E88|nr:tumor protein p63-regulated gene 1-like protein [Bombina bombina]